MSILALTAGHEEGARTFCLAVAREFGIRGKHFHPHTAQERRWQLEGIRPITQFETVGDMIAKGLCK